MIQVILKTPLWWVGHFPGYAACMSTSCQENPLCEMWELVIQSRWPVNIYRLKERTQVIKTDILASIAGDSFTGMQEKWHWTRAATLKAHLWTNGDTLLLHLLLLGEETEKPWCQLWVKYKQIQIWVVTLLLTRLNNCCSEHFHSTIWYLTKYSYVSLNGADTFWEMCHWVTSSGKHLSVLSYTKVWCHQVISASGTSITWHMAQAVCD